MGMWFGIRPLIIGPYIFMIISIALVIFIYWYNWGHRKHFKEKACRLLEQYKTYPQDVREVITNLNPYRLDEEINELIARLTDKLESNSEEASTSR